MTDSHAEQLDPSVLGEQVGDDHRPAAGYPPEEPLGVEDPAILDDGRIARDDIETRDDRTQQEPDASITAPSSERLEPGLLEPDRAPDGTDRESGLIADTGDVGPEAGALHIEDD